jgi:tetratricopeptide (TPR) repeat protein
MAEDDPNTEIREDLEARYPQEHGDLAPGDADSDVDGPAAAKHGDYYFDVSDFDQALARYLAAIEKGLADDNERARVLINIATCYHHKGDLVSGLPYITQAVELPRFSSDVGALKSYFFFREGHYPGQG